MDKDKAIVVVSGGMDSVTLAYWVKQYIETEVHGISFNYGQRHKKELDFAAALVTDGVLASHTTVDLSNIQSLVSKSSLTNVDVEVPDGLYNEETMKITVVPNRNMIMLAIAVGYAVTLDARAGVWTGVHGGDHFIYPDCRPPFIESVNEAAMHGNYGFCEWNDRAVNAPFINIGKHDICRFGAELGVDFTKTWSCYKGGAVHCGRCGTCTERKEAFALAEVIDPTEYTDPYYKREAYRG
jgi:7-cyano-7-deazaguanine synthase